MKLTMKSILLFSVAAFSGQAVLAQQSDVPEFMKELGAIEYQGAVSGMDLYTSPDFDGLWLVSPDGRTAVAGTIFSADGRDIGSVFTGSEPITSFERIENPPVAKIPEATLSEREISEMEEGVSRIQEDIFPSASLEGSHETDPANVTASSVDISSVTQNAEDALTGLSDDDKSMLIQALLVMLREVKSEAEFKASIEVWTNEIVKRHRDSLIEDASVPEITALDPPADEVSEVVEIVLDETEETVADQLLNEVRHQALWFGIGRHDAPVAYAFIDPACPYCARAIVNIGDEISEGRLQLRVAMAPVVSQNSPGLISAIFQHEEPPIAFMEHEYARAENRRYLENKKWSDLPEPVREGLLHNVDIMKKYQIRGVPFFVFDTEDGARAINGVPTAESFSDAIPDPYQGNN